MMFCLLRVHSTEHGADGCATCETVRVISSAIQAESSGATSVTMLQYQRPRFDDMYPTRSLV